MYLIRRMFSWRIANPVLSGLCRSFLWMLMGAFVLSLLLWGSSLKEQDLSMYTYIVHGIAAAFGGLTMRSQSHEQRLVSRKSYRRILWDYRSVDRFFGTGQRTLWCGSAMGSGSCSNWRSRRNIWR